MIRRQYSLWLLLLTIAGSAFAATPPENPVRPGYAVHAHDSITQVLDGADFGKKVTVMSLQPKWKKEKEPEAPSNSDSKLLQWLLRLGAAFGKLLRVLVITVVVILLIAILLHVRGTPLLSRLPLRRRAVAGPEYLPDEAVLPDTLPTDIASAAEACWQQGDARNALSLLYRGALARLALPPQELPESATEGEILRRVRRLAAAPVAADFALIVNAWQGMAYAHRTPANFTDLLAGFRRLHAAGGLS